MNNDMRDVNIVNATVASLFRYIMVHEIRRYFGTRKLAILYLSSITTTILDVPNFPSLPRCPFLYSALRTTSSRATA